MIKKIFLLVLISSLSACYPDDPGSQCLNSFKSTLKDPDSGKVISFDAPTLTYTATNSYGARSQGKAICGKIGDKWVRDSTEETVVIYELAAEKMKKFNDCREVGRTPQECAGNSLALKLAANSRTPVDIDMLKKEAVTELGF